MRARTACALWGNSIFGLVTHWTQDQRWQTGRSRTQIGALRKIPCPRFDVLDNRALAGYCSRGLREAQERHCCRHAKLTPTRPGVDEAVVEVLGLPEAALPFTADLRLLWDGNLQCMTTTGGPLPCSMPNGGPRAVRSPFVDTGLHIHRPANRWYRVHNVSMVPPPP